MKRFESHTPRPWMCTIDNDIEAWVITDCGPTQSHDGDGASECIANVYDYRNAQLIVAAPDILAERDRLFQAITDYLGALETTGTARLDGLREAIK